MVIAPITKPFKILNGNALNRTTPLYKWFVDCGFNVFAIETAKEEDLDTPLSIKDKQRNREIVLERYNEERIARSLKENIVD